MTVISANNGFRNKSLSRSIRRSLRGPGILVWLGLSVLPCAFPALAQSQQPAAVPAAESSPPNAPGSSTPAGQPLPGEQLPGTITGTVVDGMGAAIVGAHVKLTREDQSPSQEVLSGDDGQFSFANIAPGPFRLSITAAGFAMQASSGTLISAENHAVPPIALVIATEVISVQVVVPPAELAEVEVKDEEKQRVLGVIPNFYVSYVPNAIPLTPRQKFDLAWRSSVDPVTFIVTAGVAGLEQAQNAFSGYGQGAEGYGKRYGAAYADSVTSTFIGGFILPSLLKQDPRYFYKGTGSTRSRFLYAIANAVICKGDNGRWQANYSYVLGDFTSSGISNLYYPAKSRGAGLTFENAAIGIGATAAANVLQEFVIRKLTPNIPSRDQPKSSSTINKVTSMLFHEGY